MTSDEKLTECQAYLDQYIARANKAETIVSAARALIAAHESGEECPEGPMSDGWVLKQVAMLVADHTTTAGEEDKP